MNNLAGKSKGFILGIWVSLTLLAAVQVASAADWVRRNNGTGNGEDEAFALAIDASGNIFITGASEGKVAGSDFVTIKYTGTGVRKWVRRYDGPGNGDDKIWNMTTDKSRNVYVTGRSLSKGTGLDYATIKYTSSGAQKWVRNYDGSGNGEDKGWDIALDSLDNVYVVAESWGSSHFDYATIKYTNNGDLEWAKRYNGPGKDWDEPYAIAVDSSDNVCITGRSRVSGETNDDCITIKYDGNGKQLWLKRYDGPAKDSDSGWDIALDDANHVYVTGHSTGKGTGWDYLLIKY